MHTYDFLTTYFPEPADIDPERVTAVREHLASILAETDPDLDTNPGSVFGDLHLNAFAKLVAGAETAANRLLSDFDLEMVASGIVTNCDYVARYLNNFAVVERGTLQASGIMRLTFTLEEAPSAVLEIDRRLQASFGGTAEDATSLFRMRLNNEGHLNVYPPGDMHDHGFPEGGNSARFVDLGSNTYIVDIPVTGTMDSPVLLGTGATLDMEFDGLTSATALYDFETGLPPEGLPDLAARARQTIHAASMNTKGGVSRFLRKEFPDLRAVSAVMPGDAEMRRDAVNPLGIGTGDFDIHVKSSGWKFKETATVRLTYDPLFVVDTDSAGGELRGRWYGRLNTPNRPFVVTAVRYPGDLALDLGLGEGGATVYSVQRDPAVPGLSGSHSSFEDLWLEILMPGDDDLNPMITGNTVVGGVTGMEFEVEYYCDPMLKVISDAVQADDNRPVGLGILVRGFLPIHLTKFKVVYTRERGKTTDLSTARAEIHNYVRDLGYPDLFSYARIVDVMYYAGATEVVDVEVEGSVLFTPAHKVITPANDVAAEDLFSDSDNRQTVDAAMDPPSVEVSSVSAMTPEFTEDGIGLDPHHMWASCGKRDVCWLLESATIEFSEVVR
jgi:hypothetical protein